VQTHPRLSFPKTKSQFVARLNFPSLRLFHFKRNTILHCSKMHIKESQDVLTPKHTSAGFSTNKEPYRIKNETSNTKKSYNSIIIHQFSKRCACSAYVLLGSALLCLPSMSKSIEIKTPFELTHVLFDISSIQLYSSFFR
jgi:hypothetical protein